MIRIDTIVLLLIERKDQEKKLRVIVNDTKILMEKKMRGKISFTAMAALLAVALTVVFYCMKTEPNVQANNESGPAVKENVQNEAEKKETSSDLSQVSDKGAPSAGAKPSGGPKGGPGSAMMQMKTVVVLGKVESTLPVLTKKCRAVIDPIEKVRSIARVAGKITKIAFKEGDIVQKGDLLFEIEPDDYINNVEAAQATVESAAASIKEFEAKIRQIDAQIVYKTAVYRRYDDLYHNRDGAASLDDFENAASALEAAKAEKAGAEASLKVAHANLKSAQAALALKQLDLDRTKIRSEITGKTGRLTYTLGNYVTAASEPLITVAQLDPIYVKFFLSESEFNTLGAEMQNARSTSIRIMMANGTFFDHTGKITFFDNEVDTSTDNIVIWAKVDNPKGILTPGAIAKVYLDMKGKKELPSIPVSAVMRDNKGEYVWFVNTDNKVTKRRIVLGPETGGNIQCIISGLNVGETIVFDGGHKVLEGISVTDESIAIKQAASVSDKKDRQDIPEQGTDQKKPSDAAEGQNVPDAPMNAGDLSKKEPALPDGKTETPAPLPVTGQPQGNEPDPKPLNNLSPKQDQAPDLRGGLPKSGLTPIEKSSPESAPKPDPAPVLKPLVPTAAPKDAAINSSDENNSVEFESNPLMRTQRQLARYSKESDPIADSGSFRTDSVRPMSFVKDASSEESTLLNSQKQNAKTTEINTVSKPENNTPPITNKTDK